MKTRLAASVGDHRALLIYKELLRHTREIVSQTDYSKYLFYTEEICHNDDWSKAHFEKRLQSSGSLGDKILEAFEHVLASCDRCIIIGSDCPRLSTEHINQAFEVLKTKDVVIGPTYDGGYYLLGMNRLESTLFSDIDWSTDLVYEQTVNKVTSKSLTYQSIDKLSDVDYIEDWERWGWDLD